MPDTPDRMLFDDPSLDEIRYRVRALMLLEALERVGNAPVAGMRLHALAYLADVLSPVWGLPSFDGSVLKLDKGPYYPDLQRELDALTILGLITIDNLRFESVGDGARLTGSYALAFGSKYLTAILQSLGAYGNDPLDLQDQRLHKFLVELAGALAILSDTEAEIATTADATYADPRIPPLNVIDFGEWTNQRDALSVRAITKFSDFLPSESLSPGQRLYVYARYLRNTSVGT